MRFAGVDGAFGDCASGRDPAESTRRGGMQRSTSSGGATGGHGGRFTGFWVPRGTGECGFGLPAHSLVIGAGRDARSGRTPVARFVARIRTASGVATRRLNKRSCGACGRGAKATRRRTAAGAGETD